MNFKPFYIKMTDDITDEMVAEVFDKAESQGACLHEGVEGFHDDTSGAGPCDPSTWAYFGVNSERS